TSRPRCRVSKLLFFWLDLSFSCWRDLIVINQKLCDFPEGRRQAIGGKCNAVGPVHLQKNDEFWVISRGKPQKVMDELIFVITAFSVRYLGGSGFSGYIISFYPCF